MWVARYFFNCSKFLQAICSILIKGKMNTSVVIATSLLTRKKKPRRVHKKIIDRAV